MEWLARNEGAARLATFASVLVLMMVWEVVAARRPRNATRTRRWFTNLTVTILNTALLRLAMPILAVGMAVVAAQRDMGLLHAVELHPVVATIAAVLLLDLSVYVQHRLFHAVPILWRMHRVHHADPDMDVTTGLRFHPLEMALSMGMKIGAVVAIGASPEAVLVFEILLNASAMFNHSNIGLPAAVDRALRLILVTPDMHRVHHSTAPEEHHKNFGFAAPWWDYVFGSYVAQPAAGHQDMVIGLEGVEKRDGTSLMWLLRSAVSAKVLVALALVGGIVWAVLHRDALDVKALRDQVAAIGPLAPVAFAGLYAAATVALLPGSVLTLAAGAIFGPVVGAVVSISGATAGATVSFLFARYLVSDWAHARARGRLAQILSGIEAGGWRFVALTRLVPLVPFNILNYALGLTRIPLLQYVATSFICMIPGAAVYAYLGYASAQTLGGTDNSLNLMLLAGGLVGGLALLPSIVKRMRRGAEATAPKPTTEPTPPA